jgi:DNA/RNA endonuclease YhcR with UshA esterase domain
MTLLNVGAPFPNQLLTVVLRHEAKKLASILDGKTVLIIGKVCEYRGKPQIVVKDPESLIIK